MSEHEDSQREPKNESGPHEEQNPRDARPVSEPVAELTPSQNLASANAAVAAAHAQAVIQAVSAGAPAEVVQFHTAKMVDAAASADEHATEHLVATQAEAAPAVSVTSHEPDPVEPVELVAPTAPAATWSVSDYLALAVALLAIGGAVAYLVKLAHGA